VRKPPNWLLSLLSTALCVGVVVVAELALRLADPNYFYRLHAEESSNVYSETYGWELRRGFRGIDFGRMASVNWKGYRGREHEYAKSPGRLRVVMVGDSIGYGAGVEDDETFSALLETRGVKPEVVNLSVGGYGTDQELIALEERGLRYQPDVVVLNFCLFSDFIDNALPSALFDARQPKPYFTWDGQKLVKHDAHVRLGAARKTAQWLADESHLFNRVVGALGLAKPPRQPGVWMDRRADVMANLPPAADLTFHLIRRMNDVAAAAGARFVVVIHPDQYAYTHERSRLLQKFCGAPLLGGMSVVEMGERYRERGLRFEDWALDEPGHLTHLGHQIAAETMEALLSPSWPAEWDYLRTCASSAPSSLSR
jgi:hypothetical protein